MIKRKTIDEYNPDVTDLCERVLVTLLRHLGPWKESMYLIGGLVPRYLVHDRPPKIRAHAGTGDIDVVVELEMLGETEGYKTLGENLLKIGFKPRQNDKGNNDKWGWWLRDGKTVVELELLADDPDTKGGKLKVLPTKGDISAMNIPHSSMVFDQYTAREVNAELIGDGGKATETIRHANLLCFICLKAYAFDGRGASKDAHDILYCLEFAPGGVTAAAELFRAALNGKHDAIVKGALRILRDRFRTDKHARGFEKDGPVGVAKFELGEDADKEQRILRQRDAASLVEEFLKTIDGSN